MNTQTERVFVISADGDSVMTIHNDVLPDFGILGSAPRASEVEFMPGTGWVIKLTEHANNGQYRGKYVSDGAVTSDIPAGFVTREEALCIEVAFLNNKVLSASK